MIPASLRRSSNATIVGIGVMLGVYLAVLIGFGWVGQDRLRGALLEQEQLAIEKQATALAYFLQHRQSTVQDLAQSLQIHTFLANRDLGMSMRYGLRASLNAVSREFERFIDRNHEHDRRIFRRISLLQPDGHPLLEIGDRKQAGNYTAYAPQETGRIEVRRSAEGVVLVLSAPVLYKDRHAGIVVADIDAKDILYPFLGTSVSGTLPRRTALLGPQGGVVAATQGQAWSHWLAETVKQGGTVLRAPVEQSGLAFVTLPDHTLQRSYISSPWFLAAVALFSLPILSGVAYLLRLSNHNLVLKTRYQTTTQQRALLRRQNLRLQREIDKRLESEQKLVYQANYDQLTGLPNRNLAMDRLAQAIKWAKREDGNVVVLFLDLDRFKQVNDSLGHAAGDELLREAAQRLKARVRDSDTVSRLGGDEFLVVCPDIPHRADWEAIAQQMLKTLSAPFYIGDHEFFVGASIGVSAFPDGGHEPHKLLKNADIAMYAAKEKGRNRYCYYDPSMDAVALEGVRLEHNLRHALAKQEMYLLYQPIVDLSAGRTVAVEALLRWDSAELGLVPPDRFIPIAEETGMIHEIGEWVLDEACRTVSQVQPDPHFRVAVNLSSRQFSRPGRLLDCVLRALRDSGMMPSQLELEITESILIDDRQEIADLLNQLDRIGIRLSIDDFGTGYSALNYLQRFPFDVLKIDRSFTSQVPDSVANASLIRAIIAMAHALGLEVVAEGIENREQAGFLLIQHCQLGQGYLYSRPLTFEQLKAHLRDEEAATA